MTTFRKLTSEGDEMTMTVASCLKATTGQYPGVVFIGTVDGEDDVGLELPESSADRQLKRLTLDRHTVVGCTITFTRDHNPSGGKAFWGIQLAEPQNENLDIVEPGSPTKAAPPAPKAAPAKAAAKPQPAPSRQTPPKFTARALKACYADCMKFAVQCSAEYMGKNGIPVTDVAISAMTATLFIASKDAGLIGTAPVVNVPAKPAAKPQPAPPADDPPGNDEPNWEDDPDSMPF